jgi:RimJ/RimL family protein N-acetyltransferase
VTVSLRPFRIDELDLLAELYGRSAVFVGEPPDRERLRLRIARSGRLVEGRLDFAVDADGRLAGDVGARRPKEGLPPGVFELGIELFEEFRGRGYGTAALEQLNERLFREHGAERVQASTAVWNAAMRRVLEKLGFVEEGVMRAYMPRPDGGRDDYVLYGCRRR